MIRKGQVSDIKQLLDLGEIVKNKTLTGYVPQNRQVVARVMQVFISNPDRLMLVADHQRTITGFLMLGCEDYWWTDPGKGPRYATDWAFYSQRMGDGAEMLKKGIEWAWNRPRVIDVTLGTQIPKAMRATKKMYESAGLKQIGYMFYKENPLITGGTDE